MTLRWLLLASWALCSATQTSWLRASPSAALNAPAAVAESVPTALRITGSTAGEAVDRRVLKSKGKKSTYMTRPNVIFILADDLGYNSLRDEVAPFLSFMRSKGVNIPKYYSQELCTPARAALLTGRYPLSLGMQFGSVSEAVNSGLNINETTIAEVLQDAGYTTYMLGKWHLGNASPRQLPTARGFDYYMGFLSGQSDYWSKRCPEHPAFRDFMYSTSECYYNYDADDVTEYSTFLYRDKAVDVINQHNFTDSPMFMYLSFQAVHDPWTDMDGKGTPGVKFADGIPESYFGANSSVYSYIQSMYPGGNVRQYYMALGLMDSAVESIYAAVDARDVIDNTYFIFASDNGGCPTSGGRNAPLRGGKSTLFEGGTRVEAFFYSKKLDDTRRGTEVNGLFHVTDWFPTILDLAGVSTYTPTYALDGFSQYSSLLSGTDSPREFVLYNFYTAIAGKTLNFFNNAGGAIRNSQYKLLHTYTNDNEDWFTNEDVFTDDSLKASVDLVNTGETYNIFCASPTATQFKMFLFDLESDPYEQHNLYDKSDEMKAIQDALWQQMQRHQKNAREQVEVQFTNQETFTTWQYNGNTVTPWVKEEHLTVGHAAYGESVPVDAEGNKLRKYPGYCGSYAAAASEGSLMLARGGKHLMLSPPPPPPAAHGGAKGDGDPSTVLSRWDWSINDIIVFSTLIIMVGVIVVCSVMWFTQPAAKAAPAPAAAAAPAAGGGGSGASPRGSTRSDTVGETLARGSVTRSIRGSLGKDGSRHGSGTGSGAMSPIPPMGLPGYSPGTYGVSRGLDRPPSKRPSKTTPPGSNRGSKRMSRDLEQGGFAPAADPSIYSESALLLADQQPAPPVPVTQGDTALAQTLLSVLAQGMTMTVYNEKGAKQAQVTLEGGSILHWRTLKMFAKRNKSLNLRDVMFVNTGKQTKKFHLPTSRGAVEENCFSLVTSTETLDFEVSSKVERDALAQGFTILLTRFREQRTPDSVTWSPSGI